MLENVLICKIDQLWEAKMGTFKDSEKTRAKLIQAAGALFAESGFSGVTVRDIIQKAKTSLSALNYHFGGKKSLYKEVLLEACRDNSLSEEEKDRLLRLEPREALYLIIESSMKEYRGPRGSNWKTRILARECWDPSPFFEETAQEYFKPQMDFTIRILSKIVNKPASDYQVRFAVIGMYGLLDSFGEYGHLIDAVTKGLNKHLNKKNRLEKNILKSVIDMARNPV